MHNAGSGNLINYIAAWGPQAKQASDKSCNNEGVCKWKVGALQSFCLANYFK